MMEELYEEHSRKTHFAQLIGFMTSGLILALCIRGRNAVERIRKINDEIRAEYATPDDKSANVVHGSDSAESAARELKLFFNSVINL